MKITKRKDRNLWSASVKKPDGGYLKVYGKTKREVREKYNEVTEQILTGKYVEKSTMTVNEWSKIWTKNYFSNLKPRSVLSYETNLKNHVLPYFGKRRLQSITRVDIQMFVRTLEDKNLAPKTIKNVYLVISRMLRDAYMAGIIYENPANNIILPKVKTTQIMFLDKGEIRDFLEVSDSVDPHYTKIYNFLIHTGLRINELIGLTWDRYNPRTKTVLIDRQTNYLKDYAFETPKHDVIREVPLDKVADEIVNDFINLTKKYRTSLPGINKKNFIFVTPEFEHLKYQTCYNKFKRIARKYGKPELRLHDLRHTFATICIDSGMNIKSLQTILGHADAGFTLNRYGHVNSQIQREQINKLDDYFKN